MIQRWHLRACSPAFRNPLHRWSLDSADPRRGPERAPAELTWWWNRLRILLRAFWRSRCWHCSGPWDSAWNRLRNAA